MSKDEFKVWVDEAASIPEIAIKTAQENMRQCDPLAQLRTEALLVCGYDPHHKGEISIEHFDEGRDHRLNSLLIEATLGRVLLRHLNQRARAN
jgi:hypothetical protein